jgi:hypothetical protein
MVARYDLAKSFQANWRSAVATGALPEGGLVHARMTGALLVVTVRFLPDGSFSEPFLRGDLRFDHPVLTVEGVRYWLQLTEMAVRVTQLSEGEGSMSAVALMPEAIKAARARMAPAVSEAA